MKDYMIIYKRKHDGKRVFLFIRWWRTNFTSPDILYDNYSFYTVFEGSPYLKGEYRIT